MKKILFLLAMVLYWQLVYPTIKTVIARKDYGNCEKRYAISWGKDVIWLNERGFFYGNEDLSGISGKKLGISHDERISQIHYANFHGDLILIFDKSNDENGCISICRIEEAKPFVKWKIDLPSMTPSNGIIEDHFLYQAGIGFICKIDLCLGSTIWKKEQLKDPESGTYLGFSKIELLNNDIQIHYFINNEKEIKQKLVLISKNDGSQK